MILPRFPMQISITLFLCGFATIINAFPTNTTNPGCDPPSKLNPANWNCYQVNNFLSAWWTQNGQRCGKQKFYSCFASYYNYSYFQCEGVGDHCYPGQLMNWKNETESYYTLVAIANVNQYFTNMYNAITGASVIVNELMPSLILDLNPPTDQSSVTMKDVGKALTALLGTVPPPGDSTDLNSGLVQQRFLKLDTQILSKVSTMNLDFTNVSAQLDLVTTTIQNELLDLLHAAVNDFTNFSALVADGSFLFGNYYGRNTTLEAFQTLFETYLTDKAIDIILRAKGVWVAVAQDFTSPPPPGQWDTTTKSYWTDPNKDFLNTGVNPVWFLTSVCPPDDAKLTTLDQVLFQNTKNLTSPLKVFETSWICQKETGKVGGGWNGFNPKNIGDCVYSLPVCVVKQKMSSSAISQRSLASKTSKRRLTKQFL